jgi:phospholipase/carboxylesterase
MWILANHLSKRFTLMAPRAPFSVPDGGFSWREIEPGT